MDVKRPNNTDDLNEAFTDLIHKVEILNMVSKMAAILSKIQPEIKFALSNYFLIVLGCIWKI